MTPQAGTATAPAAKPSLATSGGALFHDVLGGSLAGIFAGTRTAAAATSSGTALGVDAELERAVKAQLDRGTSLDDVIATLAGSLATSVAAQLGISPQTALQRLTQAFTQALHFNDTGPPQTNAERASALVSRLRQMADLATRVVNGDPGQPIRLIAGQRSDAEQAKATPAPQPDSILRDALAALAAPASPLTPATGVPAVPAALVSVAASDGRTVALDTPAQAVATGGDTPLGRILTRALLAGEQKPAPVAAPIPGASHGLTPPGGGAMAPANPEALDAFVQAFTSALANADAATTRATHGAGSDPAADTGTAPVSGPDAAVPATGAQAPLSFAIPFVHDAVPVAPPVPASTLPQPQHVDANAVVDQVLRGLAIRTSDGQSEVRLRLVPENLGDVSVKLIVSGGSVDASLVAHSAEAQTALAGGAAQLAKTLADAGLKLQSFTVGLAGGGFADTRDQSRHDGAWTRSNARRIGGVRETGVDDPSNEPVAPSVGPPIYSARSLPGSLNYLV